MTSRNPDPFSHKTLSGVFLLSVVIITFFIASCARQTTPTGGPKDTIPPVLIASIPAKGQINYKGYELELTFDEMVILNNPKEQIIITPDVGKKYKIENRKKKVFFTFDNPLDPNTTYSVNFREAIQDITEKNPVRNLKVAFSTGPYIDSLSIEGTIYELLQARPFKDATVALYQSDTFNIFKHKPVYLTKTDAKGFYKIENLKPGNYYVYAIQDKNKNLIADSKTESYGFLAEPITLTTNVKDVDVHLVRLDARPFKLISARPYNTYYNIRAGKGIAQHNIQSLENEDIVSYLTEDFANIKIYNTLPDKDSTGIRFISRDSINNKIDTTLYVKFSARQSTPEKFEMRTENFRVLQNKGSVSGTIKFTKPIAYLNLDSIFYQVDSAKIVNFTPADLFYDSIRTTLTLSKTFDKTWLIKDPEQPAPANREPRTRPTDSPGADPKKPAPKPKVENQLYLGHAAFISIESDTSKKVTQPLKPVKLDDTGVLIVQVETDQPHFLLQLLDKNFKVLQTRKDAKKVTFEDLDPSDYLLRLVIDYDNNGQWSPGNFLVRQEPEPVVFYSNENNQQIIKLRANFEIGPLLITF